MSNEMQTKQTNAMAVSQAPQETMLKSDLKVAYLSMGQGLSDAVQEKKVELGDIYKTTTSQKIGDPDHPLDIILLHQPKTEWVYEVKPKGKTKFEFRRTEPRNAANETFPWSFWAMDDEGREICEPNAKGALEWRRVKRLSVFAILVQDILDMQAELAKVEAGDLPDPNKALMPVAVSFRSTSYDTGKDFVNFCAKAQSMKANIWRYQLPLGDTVESNDDGTFYVWKTDTTKAKPVPKDLLPFVEEWVNRLNAGEKLSTDEDGDSAAQAGKERPVNEKAASEVC